MAMNRERVITWLRREVSTHRLEHILGVERMAADLATMHHVDPVKAAQAGLLHDLAKFFPPKKLLTFAREHCLEVDEICAKIPHLIHADISAIVAKLEFGVEDEVVLRAIANHTLGQPDMDDLSCILFVADALELGRGDDKKLNKLRELSQKNLKKTVWKVCDYTLKHLVKTNQIIHPRMILTRNWAIRTSS